jgi:hypothetical protein
MDSIGAGASQEAVTDAAKRAWAQQAPAPAPAPVPAPVVQRPEPRLAPPRSGHVRGRVVGFQQRNEMWNGRYLAVWDFRVEQDSGGQVPVEMRAFSFEGAIANGDEVEVQGQSRGGRPVSTKVVRNLTSDSLVRARHTAGTGPIARIFAMLMFFAVLAFIGWIVITGFLGG